ncbi:MAG: hypothetical protein Q9187_003083 [Circinaria calcarea]
MASFPPTQSSGPNPTSPSQTLKIGTRSSALAMIQTNTIHSLLTAQHPTLAFSIHPTSTNPGDTDKQTALYAFNAKALWTSELELHLLEGKLDLIVHCLKDMPTQLEKGCALGAVLGRQERRDCVVMSQRRGKEGVRRLGELREGEVVGTSSVRRGAQLRRLYPHLVIKDVRGNVPTRLRKLDDEGGEFACLILAAAGIQRLGLAERISSILGREKEEGEWYAAVGQGALGIEIREGDEKTKALAEGLMVGREGKRGMWEALAERSCLRTLEGGCSVPIGVDTQWETDPTQGSPGDRKIGEDSTDESRDAREHTTNDTTQIAQSPESSGEDVLTMHAIVVSLDGQRAVSASHRQSITSGEDAEDCGFRMAQALVEMGAGDILKEITLNRQIISEQGGA